MRGLVGLEVHGSAVQIRKKEGLHTLLWTANNSRPKRRKDGLLGVCRANGVPPCVPFEYYERLR